MYNKIIRTAIPDVLILAATKHEDSRGNLSQSYVASEFDNIIGKSVNFIQDNHVTSYRGVVRGLHYQLRTPQAKLIRVVSGEIFDVAVDIRNGSPNFLKWVGCTLSATNGLQMFIPEGFAHGYLTLSETSDVIYKVNRPYCCDDEKVISWQDRTLDIQWPITTAPLLSEKDKNAASVDILQCYQSEFFSA